MTSPPIRVMLTRIEGWGELCRARVTLQYRLNGTFGRRRAIHPVMQGLVESSGFPKKSMSLSYRCLFIRSAIDLQSSLRYRVRDSNSWQVEVALTSPVSSVSHTSYSSRLLLSCSWQHTIGTMLPVSPLKVIITPSRRGLRTCNKANHQLKEFFVLEKNEHTNCISNPKR